MDYRRYARYSAIGGVAWVVAVTLLGYFLGNRFPAIEDNIELIAVIIVVISVVPIGLELLKARRERTSLAEAVEESLAPESDTS
jgi:membrane-associated protein